MVCEVLFGVGEIVHAPEKLVLRGGGGIEDAHEENEPNDATVSHDS